ncbi:MAG: LytR/AlgR family response regulator transcription factor [Lishizhenia sp.]
MKLRAIVIDDEEMARKNLAMLINDYCPQIDLIGSADNKSSAKELIEKEKPDLLFLDIRMPSGSEGFELLEELSERDFQVIFVTAFKDFAIKAFQANAIHYLLKPIDIEELKQAADKAVDYYQKFEADPENKKSYNASLANLSQELSTNVLSNRIAISYTKGLKIIEDDTIEYLEASGNCTTLYFNNKKRYLDTRTLKIYENILNSSKFYRIHKSYIVNLNELSEYINEDGHTVILKSGKHLPVARNRVSAFLKMLKSS